MSRTITTIDSERLAVHPEVSEALAEGRAVVALESTIITHGMPFPRNLETALAVESDIRAGGAVPATIAILDGRIRVGLEETELRRLADMKAVAKVSRADLPAVLAAGQAGSTTVAATMICAALAGIRIFATGGIGGVHRGAEFSFDISADLQELSRSPVAVVCAGAKAILDLPKTLEVLETLGVPVIGFGSDAFPAFYSRESGLAAPLRCDSAEQVASVMAVKWGLGPADGPTDGPSNGLGGGLVIANPIPVEDEIPAAAMEANIQTALQEASAQGIQGKDVTPFLLGRLEALTEGASLTANIALVRNNARLAAAIAGAYSAEGS
ncbi:pseudouridine-5'-phosphate glycosidase [Pelagibius sp.]|uniref:pseudouridine-5'-phosphate glycosidase n=1 Tax=Pelagibius sp. TaxID=1931238 RepID=UPI003BB11E5B